MNNITIAQIFYEMADILDIQNVRWKPIAYRKAARTLENLHEPIEKLASKGYKKVMELPGIGEGLAKKIVEFCETGKIKEHEKLKKALPKGLTEMMEIQGMGPKKAARLYNELGIKNIKELKNAIKQKKVSKLKGFGEKSEQDIQRNIEFYKKGQERLLLGEALPIAEQLVAMLKRNKDIDKVKLAGSLRRMKGTIKDIDILVISKKPEQVMDYFTKLPIVKAVLAKGETKSSVRLEEINVDLRILKPESYGAALNYFTGSKDHNVALRQLAIKKGYKLSEYGLFKNEKNVGGVTEESLYKKLGLNYIEPELRENRGEIEAARKNKLPKLIELKDIKGDLHVHTDYSDGENTIKEMISAAEELGYEYICISDHSKSEKIANGMSESEILKQIKEIKKIKSKVKVLTGSEVDILSDGSLDYPDSILKKLDFVIASVHTGFKKDNTQRIISALENRYVKAIGHPTGILINRREPYKVDLEQVFEVCAEKNKFMELNAHPARLDLNDINLMKAKEHGVKIVINTDSHDYHGLLNMRYGVATARRGWLEKKDILNTRPYKEVLKLISS